MIRTFIDSLRTYQRRGVLGLSVLLACGILFGTVPISVAHAEELERIVAVVDDDVILASELLSRIDEIRTRLQAANRPLPPNDVLINQVLERLILESIQLQMADRANVQISDEMLTQTLNGIAQQNKMTLEQFVQNLAKDGVSYASFRSQVKRELTINRVQQARVGPRVFVSEQEIDNWLNSPLGKTITADDYRVGHILLTIAEGAGSDVVAAAEKKGEALYEQLKAGADFCALAVANSSGANALECGDLGWRKAAQLPSLFAEKVVDLKAGDVLPPIRSSSGVHLVKLLERRGASGDVQEAKVRHILVRPSEIRSNDEAKARIDEVAAKLKAGGDFCELAKTYSEDPGSALLCGDLGWTNGEQFVKEFVQVLNGTPAGQRSEPFRSQFGWHILEVMERRSRDATSENRKQMAMRYLRSQRFDEELDTFLAQIRDDAYVDIRIGKQSSQESKQPGPAAETKSDAGADAG